MQSNKNYFFYITKRITKIICLVNIVLFEVFKSSISILKELFRKNMNSAPVNACIDTILTKRWQIVLLAHVITLTPGTIVYKLDNDRLFIAIFFGKDKIQTITDIKNIFEKRISNL
jgi:multicomponent Na+:H+ antiporter subunit E